MCVCVCVLHLSLFHSGREQVWSKSTWSTALHSLHLFFPVKRDTELFFGSCMSLLLLLLFLQPLLFLFSPSTSSTKREGTNVVIILGLFLAWLSPFFSVCFSLLCFGGEERDLMWIRIFLSIFQFISTFYIHIYAHTHKSRVGLGKARNTKIKR